MKDEMQALKVRLWYASNIGAGDSRDPAPAHMLTSQTRMGPRRAVPRKDGGPPRSIAEDGFPRGLEFTLDLNTPVDSMNNSLGTRLGLGGSRCDIHPTMDEVKPRVEDTSISVCMHLMGDGGAAAGGGARHMQFDKFVLYEMVYELAEV